MRTMKMLPTLALVPLLGCSGARSLSRAPSTETSARTNPATTPVHMAAVGEEASPVELPTACASKESGALCTPAPETAAKLCSRPHADVALRMFSKSSPWTRAYVKEGLVAWTALDELATNVSLGTDEEILIVRQSNGNHERIYDALRLDGTCVSLKETELSFEPPTHPQHAVIPWDHLTEGTREQLRVSPQVKAKVELRSKEQCVDDSHDEKCTGLDKTLSNDVVDYLKSGVELP